MLLKRSFLARFDRQHPGLSGFLQVSFVVISSVIVVASSIIFGTFLSKTLEMSTGWGFLFSIFITLAISFPAIFFILYKMMKLEDKISGPEKAFRADLYNKVEAQFSPLFPLLHQNRALWAALERAFTDAPFTAASGWRVDVTKKYDGLNIALWAPDDTARFATLVLSRHNNKVAVEFDIEGLLTNDNGHELSFHPERLDAQLPHIQNALVEALRANADGTMSQPAPVLTLPQISTGGVAATPTLVLAVQRFQSCLTALGAFDPSFGFAQTTQQMTSDLERLTRLATRHVLNTPDVDLLQDFLLPKLTDLAIALPDLMDTSALDSFRASFQGLARHVKRAVDDLHESLAAHTDQKAANALRVADIVAPAPVLVPANVHA